MPHQSDDDNCPCAVRQFAILFDDIPSSLHADDAKRFHSFASAQAHVTNAAVKHLLGLSGSEACHFLLCPTEYCGKVRMRMFVHNLIGLQMATPSVAASPYLKVLGEQLDPRVGVFWTGVLVLPLL
jgi:hypothetical protein